MSGITNHKDISLLLVVVQNLEHEDPNPQELLSTLPPHLKEKIAFYSYQNSCEPSQARQIMLSIRDVADEIYTSNPQDVQLRINTVFNRCCGVNNTAENQINDSSKIDQFLKSLEIVFIETEVQSWAGDDPQRQQAAERILHFMNDPNETSIDLCYLGLTTLPDIFDNTEMRTRLTALNLQQNRLITLPETIGSLNRLGHLFISNNELESLPESILELSSLQVLCLANNHLQNLPEPISNLINLSDLNLSNNRLQFLSESIGDLRNLIQLILANNDELQALPASIDNLRSLRNLDCTGTRNLTSVPNSITTLPSCLVQIQGSGLSSQVLERLRGATRQPGYTGPRFVFAIQDHNHMQPQQTIEQALRSLYVRAKMQGFTNFEEMFPNIHRYVNDHSQTSSLRSWLSRLSMIQPNGRDVEGNLSRKIISYLQIAESNEGFRRNFFATIDGAAQTCGDRMILSLLHLGIQHQMTIIDKKNLRAYAEFLIHGPWMVDQLEESARFKVKDLNFVDEIEVYLGFPIKLRERLNLQIDVEDMLYFACSEITELDLENAASLIEDQLSEKSAKANILVQREDWIEALEGEFECEMAAFKTERDGLLGDLQSIEAREYSRIQDTYIKNILELTKRVLGP